MIKTTILSRESFVDILDALESQQKLDHSNSKKIGRVFNSAFNANLLYDTSRLTTALDDLLYHGVGEVEDLVDHFMYEMEFGKKTEFEYMIDSVTIDLSNSSKLYDHVLIILRDHGKLK